MASLEAICAGIKETLDAGLGSGVEVYETVPANPALPCVCVIPADADFEVAMGRGVDTWTFDLMVMVPSADVVVGQVALRPFVTGAGSSSIRAIIFANRSLGLTSTHAHVASMTGYGGRFEAVDKDHVGASLRLVVTTSGTA